MDDLDDRILDLLRRDGRAPFTAIAEALDTSEATVRTRVKRLVDEGVIRQFTVRVRGANLRALVEVQVAANVDSGKLAHAIHGLDGVEEVWELTGEWDIVALVNVDDTDELNAVVDGVRRLGSATATRTRVILNEHYTNGGLA